MSEDRQAAPRRDMTKLALGVLTDVAVSDRHALVTADRLLRRSRMPTRHFVIGMGGWMRKVKQDRQPDDTAASRWTDDGGIR